MKTIELFSGIGGFRLAADSCGLKTVWANDICPRACMVYRNRFGNAELREGDLIKDFAEAIPPHDVLTGGFPCQPFSGAGKKAGIRDPRGTLFQQIVEVLREHHPQYFILENVKRLLTMEDGFHFATILSSLADLDYLIEWRLLNAMHFGLPQNRQRVFIVGVARSESTKRDTRAIESTRLATADDLSCLRRVDREDAGNHAAWIPINKHKRRFPNWGLASDGKFFAGELADFSEKSPLKLVKDVLEKTVSCDFDFTDSTLEWIGENTPVNRLIQGVEILSNQGGGARMGYTIFGTNGIAPTLTSTTSRHYERYKIGNRYRRLTNVEYARIQGFPDDHCSAISVYDQYSLIGNAVPPPMAEWVMNRLQASITRKFAPRSKRQKVLFEHTT